MSFLSCVLVMLVRVLQEMIMSGTKSISAFIRSQRLLCSNDFSIRKIHQVFLFFCVNCVQKRNKYLIKEAKVEMIKEIFDKHQIFNEFRNF